MGMSTCNVYGRTRHVLSPLFILRTEINIIKKSIKKKSNEQPVVSAYVKSYSKLLSSDHLLSCLGKCFLEYLFQLTCNNIRKRKMDLLLYCLLIEM